MAVLIFSEAREHILSMTSASLASFFPRPSIRQSCSPCTSLKQNRPFSPFTLSNDPRNSIRTLGRAFQQGPAVVSSDNLPRHGSFVKPIQEVGGTEDVDQLIDGVSSTEPEPKSQLSSRVKKKVQEDGESLESRFKLRNGREVCFLSIPFPPLDSSLLCYYSLFTSNCRIN